MKYNFIPTIASSNALHLICTGCNKAMTYITLAVAMKDMELQGRKTPTEFIKGNYYWNTNVNNILQITAHL